MNVNDEHVPFPVFRGDKSSGGRRWRALNLSADHALVIMETMRAYQQVVAGFQTRVDSKVPALSKKMEIRLTAKEARVIAREMIRLADVVEGKVTP